jgi:hypothetical protein
MEVGMRVLLFAVVAAFALSPAHAHAQTSSPASQALAACIQRSATAQDDVVLIRWIFIAMARHPSVSSLAEIPDAERVSANRDMASLFNRLVLESCPNEARAALAGGQEVFGAAFASFGERAMIGIMQHPDVNAGVAEWSSYLDRDGLIALMNQQ